MELVDKSVKQYKYFDPQSLIKKNGRIISSKEALKDVKSIEWDDETLRGEKKIVLTQERP